MNWAELAPLVAGLVSEQLRIRDRGCKSETLFERRDRSCAAAESVLLIGASPEQGTVVESALAAAGLRFYADAGPKTAELSGQDPWTSLRNAYPEQHRRVEATAVCLPRATTLAAPTDMELPDSVRDSLSDSATLAVLYVCALRQLGSPILAVLSPRELASPSAARTLRDLMIGTPVAMKPIAVWEVSAGIHRSEDAIVALFLPGLGHPTGLTHFHTVRTGTVDGGIRTADLFNALGVAYGRVPRGENDFFYLASTIAESGCLAPSEWHSADAAPRNPLSRLGLPVRELREVCTAVRMLDCEPGLRESDVAVRFDSESNRFAPCRPTERADSIVTLLDCEDPAWLRAVLSMPDSQAMLRCRCLGSIDRPILTALAVEGLAVPWPDVETRRSLLERSGDRLKMLVELRGTLEELQQRCELLEVQAEELGPLVDSSGQPDQVSSGVADLQAELNRLSGRSLDRGCLPDSPRTPGPIAIQRREVETRTESQVGRMQRLLYLGESIVRFEALVRLAALTQLGPQNLASLFRQVAGHERERVNLSFGHWVSLTREARTRLSEFRRSPVGFAVWKRLAEVDEKEVGRIYGRLVEQRNALIGHGPPRNENQAERVVPELRSGVKGAWGCAPPERWGPLHQLRGIEMRRTRAGRPEARYSTRLLTGDNQLFPPDSIPMSRQPLDANTLSPGELFIELDTGAWLRLHPWLLFDPQELGDGFWWVDAIVDKRPLYRPVTFRTENPSKAVASRLGSELAAFL